MKNLCELVTVSREWVIDDVTGKPGRQIIRIDLRARRPAVFRYGNEKRFGSRVIDRTVFGTMP